MGRASRAKRAAREQRIACPYCGKVKNSNRVVAVLTNGTVRDWACVDCFKQFQAEGFMHRDDCDCGSCGERSLDHYRRA